MHMGSLDPWLSPQMYPPYNYFYFILFLNPHPRIRLLILEEEEGVERDRETLM